MYKAVIFDMDGVLSDSEWIYVKKILEFLAEEGIRIKAEEINDLFGRSMIFICSELIDKYGLAGDARVYAQRIHKMRDDHIRQNGLYPMEGATDLVKELKNMGIPMAVASSASIETIRSNMERFGIEDCFDAFVSGLNCPQGKPWPDIFLYAAKALNKEPAECIVIEDSANGVTAAKRAGMYCYAFVPKKAVPQDLSPADAFITSFVGLSAHALINPGS